ncbi:hypothetical protein LCGC14_2896250, partial [marine sediment metagenome]
GMAVSSNDWNFSGDHNRTIEFWIWANLSIQEANEFLDFNDTGTGNDIFSVNGIDTDIGGTGTVNHTGARFRIWTGNKQILSIADLTLNVGNFYIGNSLTVTNNGKITVNGQIYTDWVTTNWINASGSTLTVGNELFQASGRDGNLVASATGNTIIYNESADQEVRDPVNGEYYNLVLAGSANKTLWDDIKVLNDLTIASTLNSANYDIEVGGDWTNTNTFVEGTGTVTINGTASQTITNSTGELFNNLAINKASDTLVLGGDVMVSGTLDLISGDVRTGSSTLTLGVSGATIGTLNHTSGTINGYFERWVNAAATAYLFPVGTVSDYRPASVTFNNVPSGSLITRFNASSPGTSGLPLDDAGVDVNNTFVEGFWEFDKSNGLNSSDY